MKNGTSGSASMGLAPHSSTIFHVRTQHNNELAKLTNNGNTKPDGIQGLRTRPNFFHGVLGHGNGNGYMNNTQSTTQTGRKARRHFLSGRGEPSQTSRALVPATPKQYHSKDSSAGGRVKINIRDRGGARPTKILATLGNVRGFTHPERTVRLTRNAFHTPTIREIGSNEDLCQLNHLYEQYSGRNQRQVFGIPNLWNESTSRINDACTETNQPNSRSFTHEDYERYKQLYESTPSEFVNSEFSVTGNAPHPFQSDLNHQGPTEIDRKATWKLQHGRSSRRQSRTSKNDRLRQRKGSENYEPPRGNDDRLEENQVSASVTNPSSSHDRSSTSDPNTNTEDKSRSNMYGSPYDQSVGDEDNIRKSRSNRGASILKTSNSSALAKKSPAAENTALTSISNNNYTPSYPQIAVGPSQRCVQCTYTPCFTCRVPVCILCGCVRCVTCAAPLCTACKGASISVFNTPLCISCCSMIPNSPPTYPVYHATPPQQITQPSYNSHLPDYSYNPFSPCSPYIDWSARCNLPPYIPNYVCEVPQQNAPQQNAPQQNASQQNAPQHDTMPRGNTYNNIFNRPNKFLELFKKKESTASTDQTNCQSCQRLQTYASNNVNIACPNNLIRCALHHYQDPGPCETFDDEECEEEELPSNDWRSLTKVLWIVAPVIVFYIFAYYALCRIISINIYTRLAAIIANITIFYIIMLEPDDLIVYPTDKPRVHDTSALSVYNAPDCTLQCPPQYPPEARTPSSHSHLGLSGLPQSKRFFDSHSAPH